MVRRSSESRLSHPKHSPTVPQWGLSMHVHLSIWPSAPVGTAVWLLVNATGKQRALDFWLFGPKLEAGRVLQMVMRRRAKNTHQSEQNWAAFKGSLLINVNTKLTSYPHTGQLGKFMFLGKRQNQDPKSSVKCQPWPLCWQPCSSDWPKPIWHLANCMPKGNAFWVAHGKWNQNTHTKFPTTAKLPG